MLFGSNDQNLFAKKVFDDHLAPSILATGWCLALPCLALPFTIGWLWDSGWWSVVGAVFVAISSVAMAVAVIRSKRYTKEMLTECREFYRRITEVEARAETCLKSMALSQPRQGRYGWVLGQAPEGKLIQHVYYNGCNFTVTYPNDYPDRYDSIDELLGGVETSLSEWDGEYISQPNNKFRRDTVPESGGFGCLTLFCIMLVVASALVLNQRGKPSRDEIAAIEREKAEERELRPYKNHLIGRWEYSTDGKWYGRIYINEQTIYFDGETSDLEWSFAHESYRPEVEVETTVVGRSIHKSPRLRSIPSGPRYLVLMWKSNRVHESEYIRYRYRVPADDARKLERFDPPGGFRFNHGPGPRVIYLEEKLDTKSGIE